MTTTEKKKPDLVTVGISDFMITSDPKKTLVTYSLGSCIGVTIYDPKAKVGALAHFLLPLSKGRGGEPGVKPAHFVDTGLVTLLNALYALGAKRENLVIHAAGGAKPMDSMEKFEIGKKNAIVLKKLLFKNNLLLSSEDFGGAEPRTMLLDLGSGKTCIRTRGHDKWL